MSLLEEVFEEPIDVFYQRWSKLADHMLADPDLNMYLCVIQYPFVGGARLREAPDLIPKWCGYFPTEKQGSLFSCWENMVRLVVGRTLFFVSR